MDVLAGASWALAPSRSEGMPLAPMEAMEARVPVLASDIGAHRELFSAAPGSLLPTDEARWPEALGALFDEGARAAIEGGAGGGAGGRSPRAVLAADARSCYDAVRS
jgi:glycosyltransferase involved in cell wall biosynthesis